MAQKNTYAANTFAAWTFRSRSWAGLGVVAVPVTVWRGRSPAAQDSLHSRRTPVADTHIGRYRERVQ